MRILLIILIFISFSLKGQSFFEKTYGGTANDIGYSVVESYNGDFIIASKYKGYFGVVRVDFMGDTILTKTYDFIDTTSSSSGFTSIIETKDSNIVLSGNVYGQYSFLIKINILGDTLWLRKGGYEFYSEVIEDKLGNLIVVGSLPPSQPQYCCNPYIQKFNSLGFPDLAWQNWVSCPSWNGCLLSDIFIDSDGKFIVSGMTPSSSIPKPRLIKIDTSGHIIWDSVYNFIYATVTDIAQSPDSGYLFTSINHTSTQTDSVYLFKVNKNGNLLWLKKYKPYSNSWYGNSIDTTSNGYLISGSNGDVNLMKLDLNYNLLWSKQFGDTLNEESYHMKSTKDGGCIIVGQTHSYGAGGSDIYLIKTDKDGLTSIKNDFTNTYKNNNDIILYPNPTNKVLNINFNGQEKPYFIQIRNYQGQLLEKKKINNSNQISLNLDLPKGVYIVEILSERKLYTKRFVKQ